MGMKLNIVIGVKSCGNCAYSDEDWGGGIEEGIPPYHGYFCGDDDTPDTAIEQDFENEDEESIAAKCPAYYPIVADKCWVCGKEINLPFSELKYACGMQYNDLPCCSEKCQIKGDSRDYWTMRYCFRAYDHWWNWLTFRIKAKLCLPQPETGK